MTSQGFSRVSKMMLRRGEQEYISVMNSHDRDLHTNTITKISSHCRIHPVFILSQSYLRIFVFIVFAVSVVYVATHIETLIREKAHPVPVFLLLFVYNNNAYPKEALTWRLGQDLERLQSK